MSAPGDGTPAKGAPAGPADSARRPSDAAATTTTLPAVAKESQAGSNGANATPAAAWTHLSAPGATPGAQARRPGEPDTDEIRAAANTAAVQMPPPSPAMGGPGAPVNPGVPPPVGSVGPQTFPGPAATMPPPMPVPPIGAPPMQPPIQPPPVVPHPPTRRPVKAAARAPRRPGDRAPRRAHLQVKHLDVWSVLKLACVLSVSLFFVWLVIVGVIYGLLDVTGVVDKVNETAHTLYNNNNDPITPGIVLGGALVIGVINIVLFIVLTTIGSVVYNLCADLVGGVEVTLSERG
jgi:Transmembrane domain of unknown function (DUF3566)